MSLSVSAASSVKGWEQVKTERADARTIIKDADIEVRTAPQTIIITSAHQIQVKVYTILGQVVSNETVAAGTSQLNIGSHGVYIVKIGTLTCKVAL